jgi:hypothetical protein
MIREGIVVPVRQTITVDGLMKLRRCRRPSR